MISESPWPKLTAPSDGPTMTAQGNLPETSSSTDKASAPVAIPTDLPPPRPHASTKQDLEPNEDDYAATLWFISIYTLAADIFMAFGRPRVYGILRVGITWQLWLSGAVFIIFAGWRSLAYLEPEVPFGRAERDGFSIALGMVPVVAMLCMFVYWVCELLLIRN